MTFESTSITKLLRRKKIQSDTPDSQNNKKLSHKKLNYAFGTRSRNFRLKRTLKTELLILIVSCSVIPLAVSHLLGFFISSEQITYQTIILVSLTAVVAILLSVLLSRPVTRPISQLTKMVNEISEGKAGVETIPNGNFELAKLAMSINRMSRELKEQHDELKRSKEKFHALYDQSPDLYRTINKDGIILECNKSYADRLGYFREEIIGKSIFDHTSEKDLEFIKDSFETWKKNGNVSNREVWLRRKDGTTFPTLLSATAFYDNEGNVLGSNTVIRDMSEIYNAKDEVRQQREKRLSAVGELSARISHDLRNPLSVIKTSVSILRLRIGTSDEKTQSDLVRIERAITRMTHQINEVLDYVNPKPINRQNTSVLQVLSSTLERLNMPDTVKINLPKEDVKLSCELEKMEVVFVNLITNAIQAMRNAGQIFIRASLENNQTIIEIEDSGPGISGDALLRLFDPLFTTRQTGTGLGLVSCKRIVEQHGGTIEAKNSQEWGALFVIRIPTNV